MKKCGVLLGSILSFAVLANPFDFVGFKPVTINTNSNINKQAVVQHKIIYVLKIKLSPKAKVALKGRADEMQASGQGSPYRILATTVPAINLGMNNTPVLDQGQHGSCVTFAVTGAINAVIGKGNYVSQLCSLSLGSYLVKIRKIPYSGWNGSYGDLVLNQLYTYGAVPISRQIAAPYRCGGLKLYPLASSKIGTPMTIAQYTALSIPVSSYLNPPADPWYNDNATTLLNNVKSQLRAGRRVTFGVLLDDTVGDAGAVGVYNKKKRGYDSWILTPGIVTKAKKGIIDAGHEMIIIGYNDNAVVSNANAKLNKKGILILRNSWGPYAGDGGNYYMSYEYFKLLTMEAQAIIPRKK
jgi:hypothetical protein